MTNTDLYLPESYGDVLVDVPDLREPAHATLGASGSERWMNCHGSINMSKGMPNKSSVYAMEGTAAHHLGELCLTQDVSADVFEGQYMTYLGDLLDNEPELEPGKPTIKYEGLILDAKNPAFPINDGMVWAVNVYLATIDKYLAWARETFGVEPQLLVEKKFNLESVYPGMFGTNDVCIYIPGKCLIVIDYKHGRGKVVQIKNNSQLKYYGLGSTIELCINPGDLPEQIETVIVQPRASHKDGPVRSATYPSHEITTTFRAELIEAAKKTEDPNAELNPGDWCFFCPGKVKCPKITGKFAELSKVDHYDLSPEELGMPEVVVQRVVANVTNDPELMGKFLAFAPIMESAIEAVREFALQQAIAGQRVPGQKIVRRDTKRKYEDEEVTAKALLAEGLQPKDIYKLKLKSQTDLKKLGKERWTKIEAILKAGGYVIKPEGALTLAEIDDAREEVVMQAFGDLSAEDLMLEGPPSDFDIL